ncbi:GUN4 N-terminal ARM-like repeat domain-containing protein [Pseudanabaenaceae cyanobacterium LEGE 13415]|nr:GUN4 N-terminal ARM-like repeat domain-containing protein [Pseudanabaenaceae cyanobacterium LEGE 13415]
MTNLETSSALDLPNSIAALQLKLRSDSEKVQLQTIDELTALGEDGLPALMEFLLDQHEPGRVTAKIYQRLYSSQVPRVLEFLQQHFPTGTVPLNSENKIDYTKLQQLLAQQKFQEADRLTIQKLCELAGESAVLRKWLYFTEVEHFPTTDLQTIDALWLAHSDYQFGFSVQRQLWLSLGKKWEKLWEKIGWKSGYNWTRYPEGFTWSLTAPKGHLPLSNQLRGVRVIAALLNHPAWNK